MTSEIDRDVLIQLIVRSYAFVGVVGLISLYVGRRMRGPRPLARRTVVVILGVAITLGVSFVLAGLIPWWGIVATGLLVAPATALGCAAWMTPENLLMLDGRL